MAKYVRYRQGDTVRYGELRDETIHPVDGAFAQFLPSADAPVASNAVKLLAPTVPSKIIAIGPGFQKIPGVDRPWFWTKPATCANDPDGVIELPPGLPAINHEGELALVIGRRAKNVSAAAAEDYIFGYTCINDVTAGDFSTPSAFPASQYFVDGKIFDGFAPLGPCIVTGLDFSNLHMETRVNGKVRQSHSTSLLVNTPAGVVSMVSHIMTLLPGDVIAMGSPPGVQPMVDGDVVEVEIENIGILRNFARDKA